MRFKQTSILVSVSILIVSGCATKYEVQESTGNNPHIKLAPMLGELPKASVSNLWKVDDQFVCGKRSSSMQKMVSLVRGQAATDFNPDGLNVDSTENFRMYFNSVVVTGMSGIYSAETASCNVVFSFSTEPNKSYTVLFDNDGAGQCNVRVVDNESPDIALSLNELSDSCL